MAGEARDAGVVEYHGVGRHVLPGERPVQAVSQLYCHERVHPQLGEIHRRCRRRRQPHHRLQLPLQERDKHLLALIHGRRPEAGQRIVRRVLRIIGVISNCG